MPEVWLLFCDRGALGAVRTFWFCIVPSIPLVYPTQFPGLFTDRSTSRDHPASEVYVTGTFDDWSKSEKLVKTGDVFEKDVTLKSADEKIYYKVRRD